MVYLYYLVGSEKLEKEKMKKLILLLFIPLISFSSFGQNNYKLGSYNRLVNKNIVFQFKEPLPPFEKSQESYSLQGNKNLVTAFYKLTSNNFIALQIYAVTIPERFQNLNWNEMIVSQKQSKAFISSFLSAGAETSVKVSEHQIKSINGKVFLEVESILTSAGFTQKQINWMTVYKNTLINIVGATLIESFNKNLSFFKDFSNSILIN